MKGHSLRQPLPMRQFGLRTNAQHWLAPEIILGWACVSRPHGATVSTLGSESSDRCSNPRGASFIFCMWTRAELECTASSCGAKWQASFSGIPRQHQHFGNAVLHVRNATCMFAPVGGHTPIISDRWPRGPMDKASAYGAGDCRFESCRGHFSCHAAEALDALNGRSVGARTHQA